MSLLAGVVLPVVAAYVVFRPLFDRDAAGRLLTFGLAVGLGTALSAAAFSIWRFAAPVGWYEWFVLVEVALWGTAMLVTMRAKPVSAPAVPLRMWRQQYWWLVVAIAAMACLSLLYFTLHVRSQPHGDWDAWAIWNLKARFMARGGEQWIDLFSPAITHAGYPHLVPAAVARLWMWTAGEPALAGAAVAATFTYAAPLVVVGSLATLRGWAAALWGGLIVVAAAPLSVYGAQQFADVPLACVVLAAVVVTTSASRHGSGWALACLAGAAVGLAGLVKNEGLPFMIGVTVAYLGWQLGLRRTGADRFARAAAFVAAAVPFWLLLAAIKSASPAAGMSRAFLDPASIAQVADTTRHALIGDALVTTLLGWGGIRGHFGIGPWVFLMALTGGWRLAAQHHVAGGFALVGLGVLAGSYYMAYLVSPYDLAWHLSTSLHRILIHLWPLFVWALCLGIPFETEPRPSTGT